MAFGPRNAFYLRISSHIILPVYLYLDNRHLEWMTDRALQLVIADLQHLILPKLRAESNLRLDPGGPANAKRGTVDTHRGESYQFAFFFRKAEPHTVLTKARNYVTAPRPHKASANLIEPQIQKVTSRKRKRSASKLEADNTSRRMSKRHASSELIDDEEFIESVDDSEGLSDDDTVNKKLEPSPSKIVKSENNESHTLVEKLSISEERNPIPSEIVDEEEEKAKPILKLKFDNYNIYGRCLCIIVEPWPPSPSEKTSQTATQRLSIPLPSADQLANSYRDRTPLFLPDFDADGEPHRMISPSEISNDTNIENMEAGAKDSDDDGLIAFSQALNSLSGGRMGSIDSDDDMDGLVLLGDADESRSLYL